MRELLPALLLPAMLGACATGYATDWFNSRTNIINPQLIRYGLTIDQSRCVGERLGARLSRSDLTRLQERAAALRPPGTAGGDGGVVLTVNHLRALAANFEDREIPLELDSSMAACDVSFAQASVPAASVAAAPAAAAEAVPEGEAPAMTVATIPTGSPVATTLSELPPPGGATGGSAPTRSTWLNLGAASSGQSIAIDAMSIEQAGSASTAWFRMTDPASNQRTNNAYRLRVDCQAQTVQPLALRQTDETGAQLSYREFVGADAAPGPAERGTVLEIAYLSLCT